MNVASQTNEFSEEELVKMAEMLKVLGHPVRLKIVVNLMENACCVKDIWSCLGLPQASVSQHLSALRAQGIVRGSRDGTTVNYEVVHPGVKKLINHICDKKLV